MKNQKPVTATTVNATPMLASDEPTKADGTQETEGTKVINLTRTTINILDADGGIVASYPPSGQLAEVATDVVKIKPLENGVPLFASTLGRTSGIPDPKEGTIYIVPTMVLSANRHRIDLFAPYKQKFEGGKPVGCEGLTR